MIAIILALPLLAVAHFVFESILAPSLRLRLRFKFFALRDALRALKIACDSKLDDKHFDYLEESINTFIGVLPRIDFAMVTASELEYRRDEEFRRRVDQRLMVLDDCVIPDAKEIRTKTLRLATWALAVNSGVVVAISLPFAMFALGYQGLKKRLRTFASIPE